MRHGWPDTHTEFTEKEKKSIVEFCCCASEIPTEVLSFIIHQITIIKNRKKVEKEFIKTLAKY